MAADFFYNKKNVAVTTITNNPLSNSGTSITLNTGDGAKFPSTYFLAILWDNTTYPNAPYSDPNYEIVLCDSRSTDTVTVNASGRGYGGTTGVQHNSGTSFALVDMKEYWDQHESTLKTGWIPVTDSAIAYNSLDNPTGVITVSSDATTIYSVGMRIKFSNGGNTIYGIITAVTSTTITFLHEIDTATPTQALHAMANSAITNFYFSTQKNPFGFPSDVRKWTVQLTDTTNRNQNSPTSGTWYNIGSLNLSVPIGSWNLSWQGSMEANRTTSGYVQIYGSLSTSSSSESDTALTAVGFTEITYSGSISAHQVEHTFMRSKDIILASKTAYYAIMKTGTSGMTDIYFLNADAPLIIRARCNYL